MNNDETTVQAQPAQEATAPATTAEVPAQPETAASTEGQSVDNTAPASDAGQTA